MKQEEKKVELNKVMGRVKGHVEQVFKRYNNEVEKRNNDQIGGILHKNDKSEKIYSNLQDIAKELSTTPLTQKPSKNNCNSAKNSEKKGATSSRGRLQDLSVPSTKSLKTKISKSKSISISNAWPLNQKSV
jgi:hypothetical protein